MAWRLLIAPVMRLFAVAAIVLTSFVAAAQAPGQTLSFDVEGPPEPMTQTVKVSYRDHVLLADGLSVATMTLGTAATRDENLFGLGFSGYVLGAPIVHLAHGRGGAAAKSFALRVGLPLAGGFLGFKLGPNDVVCAGSSVETDYVGHGKGCEGGSFTGLLVGMLGGAAAAVYVDARYLATYEKSAAPTWSAGITRTNGGAMVGIGRAF